MTHSQQQSSSQLCFRFRPLDSEQGSLLGKNRQNKILKWKKDFRLKTNVRSPDGFTPATDLIEAEVAGIPVAGWPEDDGLVLSISANNLQIFKIFNAAFPSD